MAEKTDKEMPEENTGSRPKMEIEISQHKNLVDALDDPKKVAKIITIIFIIIVLATVGLSFVAIFVKQFYPYSAVNSNDYGATIIKNEDKEVIYWLFNSADMWANSGIKVKKGDIITVRTSGSFSTAIHHIVDAAKENREPESPWFSPQGGVPDRDDIKDGKEFRIAPYAEPNVVLMQSVPDTIWQNEEWKKGSERYWDYIDGGAQDSSTKADIYVIGREKRDIIIRRDGTLHFSCNEIAFTSRKIEEIKEHNKKVDDGKSDKERIAVNYVKKNGEDTRIKELDYYRDSSFIDAWFVDNIGSVLVVIEKQ